MVAILSAVISIFAFRFRGRASLEIELIALRHQVTVLRRQRPGRLGPDIRPLAYVHQRDTLADSDLK
jgi:hypothetical protein